VDLPGIQVVRRYAAKRKNRTTSDRDTWPDHRSGCEPNLILHNNRLGHQIEAAPAPVMASRAKVNSLGKAAMITDANLGKIVEPYMFPDPAIITNLQPPGEFYLNSRLDGYATADASAKQSQERHSPS
jgi:hypothetical protein